MIFLSKPLCYQLRFKLDFYYTVFPNVSLSANILTTGRSQIDFSLLHVVDDRVCGAYLDLDTYFISCNNSARYKDYLLNLKTFGVRKL